MLRLLRRWSFQIPDLFNQVGLLIIKLIVICSVCLELTEEFYQFGLIFQQDIQNGLRFIWICHKNLMGKEKSTGKTLRD